MKRVLIDLEENGCTVKEAVDYLKGLGYREDKEHVVPYNTTIVFAWHNGIIDALSDRPTDIDGFCKAADYEKLTIKEKPIVFSNPLMQHIGREVVVNDGEGDFTGWVVGFEDSDLTVDLGVRILGYTHDADLGGGKRTYRWFKKSDVKFVNEDGSLSDE